jgi:hypothetical protein
VLGWLRALCGNRRKPAEDPPVKTKYEFRASQEWAGLVARLRTEWLDDGATVVLYGSCPDCRHELSVELPIGEQTGLAVTEARDAEVLADERGSRAFRKIARCNCQMEHEGRPKETAEGCGSYGALWVG